MSIQLMIQPRNEIELKHVLRSHLDSLRKLHIEQEFSASKAHGFDGGGAVDFYVSLLSDSSRTASIEVKFGKPVPKHQIGRYGKSFRTKCFPFNDETEIESFTKELMAYLTRKEKIIDFSFTEAFEAVANTQLDKRRPCAPPNSVSYGQQRLNSVIRAKAMCTSSFPPSKEQKREADSFLLSMIKTGDRQWCFRSGGVYPPIADQMIQAFLDRELIDQEYADELREKGRRR
jgi:hypothetical protein